MKRRVLEAFVLAAFAVSLVVPSLSAALAAPNDCPRAPAGGTPHSGIVATMPDGACDHTDAGLCLAAIGCLVPPTALGSAPTRLWVATHVVRMPAAAAPLFEDLFRAGPPSPPPNLN